MLAYAVCVTYNRPVKAVFLGNCSYTNWPEGGAVVSQGGFIPVLDLPE